MSGDLLFIKLDDCKNKSYRIWMINFFDHIQAEIDTSERNYKVIIGV